jgi:N-methylhydantoinase A
MLGQSKRPLHVLAIARELHIPKVIVPPFPSHFSALGMLLADERHDFIRTFYADLAGADFAKLLAIHDEMAGEATAALRMPAKRRGASISISAM